MNIDEALDRFLVQLEADGRSPHTIAQYRRHIRTLARWAAGVGHTGRVADLSHEDLARFLAAPEIRASARGGTKKASTTNCVRTSLQGFCAYLHRAGVIASDPSRVLRRAKCGRPPPRGLSDDDATRLLATLAAADGAEAKRDHLLFDLLLRTGIRLTSALALEVRDVDLDRGELWLRTTKGDQPERVFLGAEIREHLTRYLAEHEGDRIFALKGRVLGRRHAHRRLSQWLTKAGVKTSYSPHALRHAFAQRIYRETGDVLVVKEALRHRSIASTMVYARADDERVRAAVG